MRNLQARRLQGEGAVIVATDDFAQARDLFLDGVQDFEAGRLDEAERRFRLSLERVPGRASTLSNLGATLVKLTRPEEALAVLDQALAAQPGQHDAWGHRANALNMLRRHAEALAAFDQFLQIQPAGAQAWFLRGETLQALERHDEALASYDKALAIDPTLGDAWSHRGGILRDARRLEEAAASFKKAIAHGADAELNSYFLAALTGDGRPAAPPGRYVEFMFDGYAEKFDEHLVQVLHYQAHKVLVDNLEDVGARPFRSALDLGCGTGLCGPLLKPLAARIYGVDLSQNMLEKARALGVYDHLAHADIATFLCETDERHDLVLSADVFIYVGDLEAVFAGVRRVIEPGGVFCFSAECAQAGDSFELRSSLRYAHSERYLRALAARHGFDVVKLLQHPIREDQREPVPGLFVYLAAQTR